MHVEHRRGGIAACTPSRTSGPRRSRVRARPIRSRRGAVRTLPALALAALAIAVTSSCSNESVSDSPLPSTTPVVAASDAASSLLGKTFTSVEVGGAAIPGGGPLEITFPEAGRVSMTAGCNRHIGSVEIGGDTMTFGQLASTRMACPPPRDGADAWLAEFTNAPLAWSRSGDELTLTDGPREVVLTEADPQ